MKFLVFDIEEMAEIAEKLERLYCAQGRRGKRKALTEEALGEILDRLHAEATDMIAAEDKIRKGLGRRDLQQDARQPCHGPPDRGQAAQGREEGLRRRTGSLGIGRERALGGAYLQIEFAGRRRERAFFWGKRIFLVGPETFRPLSFV